MFSPVWVHIYSYLRNWELHKSSIFHMWMAAISVTCPLFCPTPAAVPPSVLVPPCLCSDDYTSRICVCTLRSFSFSKILEMSRNRHMSKTQCKWLNYRIICNYANVSHQLGIRHWLMISNSTPSSSDGSCMFPTPGQQQASSLASTFAPWKIKNDVVLLFKHACPWLLMK